jgi:hypothetical protein
VLKYDTDLNGYVVNLDKSTLEKRPPTTPTSRSTSPTRNTAESSTTTTTCRPTGSE